MNQPSILIRRLLPFVLALGLGLVLLPLGLALAQGPGAFTYQGRLRSGYEYVTGTCSFEFRLYDAATGGNQLGLPLAAPAVTVTDGFFTVLLDFGDVFTTSARYLEIRNVNCGRSGDPVNLAGRVEIGFAPSAAYAASADTVGSVPWANVTGLPAGFADGVDNGLTLSCANNETLVWSGGAWQCTKLKTDHQEFAGRDADDHPQYLLLNGTRPMSGNLNLGSNRIIGLAQATANGQAVPYEQAVKIDDPAGGDLTGTYPNPTVARLQGNPVATTPPLVNQILTWQNNAWRPAPPQTGGPAGGDLTGTYPDPTVARLQGRAISTNAPAVNQVLAWNSATNQWTPSDVVKEDETAGGDLAGTYPNPTVVALQGKALATTAPTDGQVLTWNNTAGQWQPTAIGMAGAAGGDLSGTYPNPTVAKLQGNPVAATTPTTNDVLTWDGLQWKPDKIITLQGRPVSPATPATNQILTWDGSQWAPANVGTLQGRTVANAAPATNQALQWDGAQWTPGDVVYPGQTPGGHLAGTFSSPTVRANVVGMLQLDVPMGYGAGSVAFKDGSSNPALYIVPDSTLFTPAAGTTKCLVAVNAYIESISSGNADNDPQPYLRTARDVNGVRASDGQVGMQFAPDDTDSTTPIMASANYVWDMTSSVGQSVKFGCYATDPDGNWDTDEVFYCRVIYICQ